MSGASQGESDSTHRGSSRGRLSPARVADGPGVVVRRIAICASLIREVGPRERHVSRERAGEGSGRASESGCPCRRLWSWLAARRESAQSSFVYARIFPSVPVSVAGRATQPRSSRALPSIARAPDTCVLRLVATGLRTWGRRPIFPRLSSGVGVGDRREPYAACAFSQPESGHCRAATPSRDGLGLRARTPLGQPSSSRDGGLDAVRRVLHASAKSLSSARFQRLRAAVSKPPCPTSRG